MSDEEQKKLCINYFVLLNNVFWVFSVAGLEALISKRLESHSSDVKWRGLLGIANVERQMIEGEKASAFGLSRWSFIC